MGCGSSSSTAAIAAGGAESDIVDRPKEPLSSGSTLPASSLDVGRLESPDSGVPMSAQTTPHLIEEPTEKQASTQSDNHAQSSSKSCADPSAPLAEGPPGRVEAPVKAGSKPAAFDVAFDSPQSEHTKLAAPRRLPRLEKLEVKRPSTSKGQIQAKIDEHSKRRDEELAKRTQAQKKKQSRRDKLLAEVQAARELEAAEAAAKLKEENVEVDQDLIDVMDIERRLEEGDDFEERLVLPAGVEAVADDPAAGFGDNTAVDHVDDW